MCVCVSVAVPAVTGGVLDLVSYIPLQETMKILDLMLVMRPERCQKRLLGNLNDGTWTVSCHSGRRENRSLS